MNKKHATIKKIITVSMIMLMLLTALTGCGGEEAKEDEMTTLVLGTSADYAPFEFMYPDENGDMQFGGIDIYVSEYIADYMGLELQVENMSFNNLLTSLGKGQFDMVLADIEATDERKEAADFSDPYLTELAPQFLVKAENADKFKSYSDFEGKTIGAQTATTKYNIISEIPDVSPVALQNVLDLIKEVSYGKVDAILVDGSVAQQYQATNDDLVALSFDELGTSADVCVAVAKGDPKGLLPKINEAIAKMNEENKIEEFKKTASDYADVWQEVSAPEE
ncbi:MAG: transporter substrate-binding domain-containing protein [Anaerovoracaceae bacterium]